MIDSIDHQDAQALRAVGAAIKWAAVGLGALTLILAAVAVVLAARDLQQTGPAPLFISLLCGMAGVSFCVLLWSMAAMMGCLGTITDVAIRAHLRAESQRSRS